MIDWSDRICCCVVACHVHGQARVKTLELMAPHLVPRLRPCGATRRRKGLGGPAVLPLLLLLVSGSVTSEAVRVGRFSSPPKSKRRASTAMTPPPPRTSEPTNAAVELRAAASGNMPDVGAPAPWFEPPLGAVVDLVQAARRLSPATPPDDSGTPFEVDMHAYVCPSPFVLCRT